MRRRAERVSSLIRDVVGELLLSKISDPRVDPARVSVTHVEVAEDLTVAKVFISVTGDPRRTESENAKEQTLAVRALQHAAGRIQELMMRQISLRFTPRLEFVEDEKFKKTLKTYQIIQQAMDEIRQKEQAKAAAEDGENADDGQRDDEGDEDEKPERGV